MKPKLSISESKFLENSRITLTNAESSSEIKAIIADLGYDEAKIAEGWQIYHTAKSAWEQNKKESTETRLASNAYHAKFSALQLTFKRHRDLSLILCKNDPDILIQLGVQGRFPTKYNEFFDKVKLFYTEAKDNASVQQKLAIIKITPEVATNSLSELDELLKLRADFDREMGESQTATVSKNQALSELIQWIDNFEIILKVALYDQPQHMEILGIKE
jgi:hypothetical protein